MDNDAFRATYREVNPLACPFEKTILTNNGGCSLAHRFCIAEREGVQCGSESARGACISLLDLLRQRARFALKSADAPPALPHAKAMRIQVGGLRGIRLAMTPEHPVAGFIEDIRAIVAAAIARYDSLEQLPFTEIMRQISAYEGRRHGRRPDKRR